MRFIQHIILLVLVANSLMPMVDKALDGKVSELIGYDLSLLHNECETEKPDNEGNTGAGLVNPNKQTLQEPKPHDVNSSPAKSFADEPSDLIVLPYLVKNHLLSEDAGRPKISFKLKKWTYYSKSSPISASLSA